MILATVRRLLHQFLHPHNLPPIKERSIGTNIAVLSMQSVCAYNSKSNLLLIVGMWGMEGGRGVHSKVVCYNYCAEFNH